MVRTKVVNLAYQLGNDAAAIALGCEEADVLFVCEALTLHAEGALDLRKLLPVGWAVFQDLSSAARAGSAVCWRTSTMAADGPGELFPGSPAIPGQRARYIASQRLTERATGDSRPYAAFHAPKRSTDLQDEFYASLRRYAADHPRAVLGGDCNRAPTEVANLLGRRVVQAEVMALLHPSALAARAGTPQTTPWSDHPIIRATLATVPPKEPPVSYLRILWAPAVLRAAGLTVVEHAGWKERGLSTARRFEPVALVWHHDASAVGDSPGVPDYMIRNFASAGAQIWVDRQGRWHIVASGRAAHAGEVLPGMPGNETSIGIETDHTTGEAWPPALLTSLRKGSAALLKHMGRPATAVHFHKTICSPRGRKVDPDGLELAEERGHVAALMAPPKPAVPAPIEEDEVSAQEVWNHKVPFKSDPDKVGDTRPAYVTLVDTNNRVQSLEDKVDGLEAKLDAILAAVKP